MASLPNLPMFEYQGVQMIWDPVDNRARPLAEFMAERAAVEEMDQKAMEEDKAGSDPVAVSDKGKGKNKAANRWTKVDGARSASVSSSAGSSSNATTPCFRGSGPPPPRLHSPQVTPGGLPRMTKQYAKECIDVGKYVLAAESAVASSPASFLVDLEDDAVIVETDRESVERPRKASKPSEPHPGKQSALRGVTYNVPAPKIVAKKPDVKVTPPTDWVADDPSEPMIARLIRRNKQDSNIRPNVMCWTCPTIEHWKLMHQIKHTIEWHEKKDDGKEDKHVFENYCWCCIMKQENLDSEGAARAWIESHRAGFARKQKAIEKYKIATTFKQAFFAFQSKREGLRAVRILESRDDMVILFAPMAEFILIKKAQMDDELDEWSDAMKLMEEMRQCSDHRKVIDYLDRIQACARPTPCLAFAGAEDGDRKWAATTYCDDWVGCLGGWFRSWFVCLACGKKNTTAVQWGANGTKPIVVIQHEVCLTVIPSKIWGTKFEDPMAPHQKWYCWDTSKYNAGYGVIVEMMTLSKRLVYAWAQCPSTDVLDIRALKIEAECPNMTADEIYEHIPVIPPTCTSGAIQPHPAHPHDGRYFKVDAGFFNTLPTFEWQQVYNLTGCPREAVKATGQKAMKARDWSETQTREAAIARVEARKGTPASSLPPRK